MRNDDNEETRKAENHHHEPEARGAIITNRTNGTELHDRDAIHRGQRTGTGTHDRRHSRFDPDGPRRRSHFTTGMDTRGRFIVQNSRLNPLLSELLHEPRCITVAAPMHHHKIVLVLLGS